MILRVELVTSLFGVGRLCTRAENARVSTLPDYTPTVRPPPKRC
jgi:hypothetical protein